MKPEYYNYLSRREKLPDDPEKGIIFALIDDGKILLERRLDGVAESIIMVPGGRRKVDETKDFALIGELLEECGIFPTRYEFLGDIIDINIPDNDIKELAVFLIQDFEGILENKENINIHIWIDLKQAAGVCNHEVSRQVLSMVRNTIFAE